MIWSLSEPYAARTWWPCKDLPRDKADSADIVITVPNNLIVASNGTLREETEISGDRKRFWWHEKYPIATYLISIAIYPYRVYYDEYTSLTGETMPLNFYVFPENYDRNYSDYAQTKTMIHAFATLYGEYPFVEEKYGHAEFLGWASGMEHQTLTSLNGSGETLIAHELSHQWWGDMVTCHTFHDIWLNEGFATYSEALWMEWRYGKDRFHNYQKNRFYYGSGTIYVEDPQHDNIFSYNLSYRKASCVLHMLRHVVGDSTFFEILHTYYNDPQRKYGTVTTEQFQQICEDVSGMNLEDFFQQWIYEEGYPYYQYAYNAKPVAEDKYYFFGLVKQVQNFGPIFKMPVDVTISMAGGDTTFSVWVQNETDTFSVILPENPTAVTLDKDDWILCKKRFSDEPLLKVELQSIQDSSGNNNNHWDAGETIGLIVSVSNEGLPLNNVKLLLSTNDAEISIQDSIVFVGGIAYQQTVSNDTNPFILAADESIFGKFVPLEIKIFDNDIFVGNASFIVPVGAPSILLIDDDINADYESYYKSSLENTNNYFAYWETLGKIYPDSLNYYKTVLWFQGTQASNLQSADFRNTMENYIDQGGRVIIFSQNLAEFLANSGSSENISFLSDYLGVVFEGSASNESVIIGELGDPVTGGLALTFTGPYGINNQLQRDLISPAPGAHSIFNYIQSQKSAGIRFEPNSSGARVVYLAFGLEGVAGPNEKSGEALIARIFDWFSLLTPVYESKNERPIEKGFLLKQNFPNPFNPTTEISFSLPSKEKMTLTIYNVAGQRIRTLFNGMKNAGVHSIQWDGKDASGNQVASGVYIYRLKTTGFSQQKKMLLIR